MTDCDLIVCGLGGMGSAAFYTGAQRGCQTIGIDPHAIGHSEGSSHGETRLIRRAYFEHPDYVPLLNRAYELWDDLDTRLDSPLFHRTGLVIYGPDTEGGLLGGIRQSAQLYNIPIQIHDSPPSGPDADRFHLPAEWKGILEPDAGYLEVERAITEHVRLGREAGGQVVQAGLASWRVESEQCIVSLTNGDEVSGKHLVLALGAWSPQLLQLDLQLQVHRVPLYWFRPNAKKFTQRPCYAFDTPKVFFYGFEESRGLVKIAPHVPGPRVDPDSVDRARLPQEDQQITEFVRRYIPALDPEIVEHKVCMYTMSEDEHFILDQHPLSERVTFAAGMSGHGFKFSTVVGEVLVDLAITGQTEQPIEFLRRGRFT